MRRVRGCEILAVTLVLALLLNAELVFTGAAVPSAPAGDPRPAQVDFDGVLVKAHALARTGASTHPTVGKFVAAVPAVDDAWCGRMCAAAAQVVALEPAFSTPRVPSVRAPPPIAVA